MKDIDTNFSVEKFIEQEEENSLSDTPLPERKLVSIYNNIAILEE